VTVQEKDFYSRCSIDDFADVALNCLDYIHKRLAKSPTTGYCFVQKISKPDFDANSGIRSARGFCRSTINNFVVVLLPEFENVFNTAEVASRLMEDIQYNDTTEDNGDLPVIIKTLVPSPVIKCIFEANLRAPDSQDIIFIKVLHS
jgi:hypothetical protein